MKRYLLTLLAFAILILPCAVWGATYYVSSDGTGDGTAVGTPDDMAFVNATDFANGDVIVLKSGDTFTTTLTLAGTIAGDGVTGLTIRASEDTDGDWGAGAKDKDVDGKPLINGNSTRPVRIYDTNGNKITSLTVQNLDLSGQEFSDTKTYCAFFYRINTLVLDGIDMNGATGIDNSEGHNALYVRNLTGTSEIKNCTIQNYGPSGVATAPVVGGVDNVGLLVWGINDPTAIVNVHDNTVHNINSDCFQPYVCNGGTINVYDNLFYNGGENSMDVKGSDNVNFYRNKCYRTAGFTGCSQSNSYGNLIVVHGATESSIQYDSQNVKIYENYFYDHTETNNWAVHMASEWTTSISLQNVWVYNNKIVNVWGGINQAYSGDNVYIFNNIVYNTPAGGRFFGYQLASTYPTPTGNGVWIAHNTAYSANNIGYGILGVRGNTTYVNLKNNVITCNYNGNVSLLTHQNDPKSTLDGNIWANLYAGDQTIITFGATSYTEAQQATWNAVTSVGTDTFGDPGFNNASSGQLWASGGAVAMVNNANVVDITATISEAAQGPISTSDWSTSTPDVNTIARADNTSADAGAYEYLEEDVWTECAVALDLTATTSYLKCGETTDFYFVGTEITKSGGFSSVCKITVVVSAVGDLDGKTLYLEEWTNNHPTNYALVAKQQDISSIACAAGSCNSYANTEITFSIPTAINLTEGRTLVLTMNEADASNYFQVNYLDSATTDLGEIERWADAKNRTGNDATRDFAFDIYTGNDVTPAAVTAIGVWNGTDTCEQNVTETYSTAQTITLCAELDKDVPVPPAQMGWTMTCGPEAGNTVSGTYMRVDAEGATTVLLADFALTAGMRITNPQTSEITGFETAQLTPTLSAGDVDGTGEIKIAISADWLIGDEGNYSTLTALKAATTIEDGDDFNIGTVTESGAVSLADDDCTELAPCSITLSGDWTHVGAGLTIGDWWTTAGAGNQISGAVTGGANNVIQRVEFK